MIKSLFDYDDEDAGDAKPQPKEDKTETAETEESIKQQLEQLNLSPETPAANTAPADDESETITQIRQPQSSLNDDVIFAADADDEIETIVLPKIEQVYADAGEPTPADNDFPENRFFEAETEAEMRSFETEPAVQAESTPLETELTPQQITAAAVRQYRNVLQNENAAAGDESVAQAAGDVSPTEVKPLTTAETIRQSGMAWSAAVGLFGSVLFMMILGWFFDLLTGASPFGIVAGIIIGAGIGFYQFFRTTSQIFKK